MENHNKEVQQMGNTISIRNSGNSENCLDIWNYSKSDVDTFVKAMADQEQDQDIEIEG